MEDDEVLGIFAAKKSGKGGHTPIYVSVMLDQKSCKVQLDTGAIVSILPKVLYDQQFNQWPLRGTKIKLKACNGVQIPVCGEVYLPVVYEQQELVLPLIVVDGDGPPLLARNWLEQLKLNFRNIFHVSDTCLNVISKTPHSVTSERCRRVTPSIKFAGIHLYTWVERGIVRVSCPRTQHNIPAQGSNPYRSLRSRAH